jgi:hypothetical protein
MEAAVERLASYWQGIGVAGESSCFFSILEQVQSPK